MQDPMQISHNIKKLIKYCKGRHVWIQTHDHPDADALSSAMGLQAILQAHHISSKICYSGNTASNSMRNFQRHLEVELFHISEIATEIKDDDFFIYVDCQKCCTNVSLVAEQHKSACIDHHPEQEDNSYVYKDIIPVGACASIICQYMKELHFVPNSNIATALLYGLKIDTKNFTRGVTPLDLKMHCMLFDYADQKTIFHLESAQLQLEDLLAYAKTIENIRIFADIGFSSVPHSIPDELVGTLSDFILSLDGVNLSVLFSQRPEGVKLSVRNTLDYIDAGVLVNRVLTMKNIGSGGGHPYMAGGFIPISVFEQLKKPAYHTIIQMFMKEIGKILMEND